MPSKTVLSEVKGFTPLIDVLVKQYDGVVTAAVFGRVWRYCQGPYNECSASLQTIADELGLSYATVLRHIKSLCADGYLEDKTPNLRNRPHRYADTGKVKLQVLLKGGLSESKTTLSQSKGGPIIKIDEDTKKKQTKKEEEKEEEISFDSLESHPDSIKSKRTLPPTQGYEPSVADPSEDPPEIKDLARQLAPPIDLVWDYDRATDKALLHAARELIKQCKAGDIEDILDALDAYLEKNAEWVRENIDSPMGLVTLVARQYQKLHGQAQRKAAASTEWAEAAARSQVALEGRLAEVTESDRWWQDVLSELALQMTTDTFDARLKDTVLLERQDARIVVGVANEHAKDWLENRLDRIIKRTLVGFGVDTVAFELMEIQGGDVRPLMGG